MKLLLLASLASLALAAPQVYDEFGNVIQGRRYPEIKVLNQYFNQDGRGNYEYGYEQDNGQKVDEVGKSYPGPLPETGTITKDGGFQWIAPNGQQYSVSYSAGEQGFVPQGAHLPVPPTQIPEYAQLRQQYPELFSAEQGK